MIYREVAPSAPLRRFVKCFWLLQGRDPSGRPERVLPDGCCELILNLADPFRNVERGRIQPDLMAVGQIRRFIQIEPTGAVHLIGIRFKPGGLHPFLHLPMAELTEDQADLRDVNRGLRADLEEASRKGVEAVERVLLARLGRTDGAVEAAVRAIEKSDGRARMDVISGRLGVHGRRLERIFQREVGIAPKLLARIVRFQNVIRTIESGRFPDWTALALECGYYDQAHLIRDFSEFAGLSPEAYFATEHPMADFFVGVSDSSNMSA